MGSSLLLAFALAFQMGSGDSGAVASKAHGVWLNWDVDTFASTGGTVTVNRATGDCTTNGGFSPLTTGVNPFGPYRDVSVVSGTTYAYTVDLINPAHTIPDSGPSNCATVTAP